MLHHFVSASLADSTLTVLCPSSTSTILPVTSLIQSFWSSSSNLAVPAIHRSTNFPPWKIPNRSCLSSHLSIKYSMPALASLLNKAPYIVSSLLSTNSCFGNESNTLIPSGVASYTAGRASEVAMFVVEGNTFSAFPYRQRSRGRSRNETLGRRRSSSCSSSKLGSADFSLFVSSIIVEIEFSD
ncbi:hypothetical protein KCV05_g44, partial [Aureobasidium melanogenum]